MAGEPDKPPKQERYPNLSQRGTRGNKGGTGRPSNVIRIMCQEEFRNGIPKIAKILRAKPGEVSESDRLRALDLFGKYGLGEASMTEEIISRVAKVYITARPDATEEELTAFAEALEAEFR